MQVSANYSAKNMIVIVAANNQILEMPVYQEAEFLEVIPGTKETGTPNCCQNLTTTKTAEQLMEPQNLSKIFDCVGSVFDWDDDYSSHSFFPSYHFHSPKYEKKSFWNAIVENPLFDAGERYLIERRDNSATSDGRVPVG